MYIRSTGVKLEPNNRETAEKIGEYFNNLFKKQPGFIKVYFGINDETGASIAVTIWETKEGADLATQYIKGAATQVYEIVEF